MIKKNCIAGGGEKSHQKWYKKEHIILSQIDHVVGSEQNCIREFQTYLFLMFGNSKNGKVRGSELLPPK